MKIPPGERNHALSISQTWLLSGHSRTNVINNVINYYWYYGEVSEDEAASIVDEAGYLLQLAGYDTAAYPLAGLAPTPDSLPAADVIIDEAPDLPAAGIMPSEVTTAAAAKSAGGLNWGLVAGLSVLGLGGGYALTHLMKRRR